MRQEEYMEKYRECGGERLWYGYPRGFTCGSSCYINDGAFYFGKKDKTLLILHERGHLEGREHSWFGIMSPYSVVRYLTTFRYEEPTDGCL